MTAAKQHGVSLTELMIAVAILGVVAAIAAPVYNSYIADSRSQAMLDSIQSIRAFQEDRRLSAGRYVEGEWDVDGGDTSLQTNLGWSPNTDADQYIFVVECLTDGTPPQCARTSAYKVTATHKSTGASICRQIPGNTDC